MQVDGRTAATVLMIEALIPEDQRTPACTRPTSHADHHGRTRTHHSRVSVAPFYRGPRLKELERENGRLRRIVADKELEIDALRMLPEEKW